MTLKVAGVGAGYFAQFHYEAWQRMPDVGHAGPLPPLLRPLQNMCVFVCSGLIEAEEL